MEDTQRDFYSYMELRDGTGCGKGNQPYPPNPAKSLHEESLIDQPSPNGSRTQKGSISNWVEINNIEKTEGIENTENESRNYKISTQLPKSGRIEAMLFVSIAMIRRELY
jgi:hypothetical protein